MLLDMMWFHPHRWRPRVKHLLGHARHDARGMRGREMRVPFDHLHRFMAEYFGNLYQIVVSLKIGPGSSGRRSYPWGRPSSMARSMLLRVRA